MGEPEPTWKVSLHRDAEKILRKLPRELLNRVWGKIKELEKNPRPHGCKKLQGYANLYRVRVGDWRISYAVEDEELIVLILEVAPRGGAYRDL